MQPPSQHPPPLPSAAACALVLEATAIGLELAWLVSTWCSCTAHVPAVLCGCLRRLYRPCTRHVVCLPGAVVPPMYEMLNPDRRLTLGQTMALLFPADDPQGESAVTHPLQLRNTRRPCKPRAWAQLQ